MTGPLPSSASSTNFPPQSILSSPAAPRCNPLLQPAGVSALGTFFLPLEPVFISSLQFIANQFPFLSSAGGTAENARSSTQFQTQIQPGTACKRGNFYKRFVQWRVYSAKAELSRNLTCKILIVKKSDTYIPMGSLFTSLRWGFFFLF